MKPGEKRIERMNYLFFASMILPLGGMVLALVGLIARQSESSRHWGIWCSIIGWSLVPVGFLLRSWVKRWFRKLREEDVSPATLIDLTAARELVKAHLRKMEAGSNAERANHPPRQIVIAGEQEHDFGWIFFWNTQEFVDTGDHRYALVGNTPLVVDRNDGQLYAFSTASPLERSIEQYRKGIKHRVKDA